MGNKWGLEPKMPLQFNLKFACRCWTTYRLCTYLWYSLR